MKQMQSDCRRRIHIRMGRGGLNKIHMELSDIERQFSRCRVVQVLAIIHLECSLRSAAAKRVLVREAGLGYIPNLQPSWLTTGIETGKLCLHAGGNDFGSVMIEENVVSSAGADHWLDINTMPEAIKDAGFIPKRRNQLFEILEG